MRPFSGQKLTVLDFGCYTGQLLTSLPDSFQKYGIEPNQEAAVVAESRGINVIAPTLDELHGQISQFDVVICCDVLEHVPNPLDLLMKFRSLLKEAGILIVSTGNSDSVLWRLTGARFWYCQYAEHISFVGAQWIRRLPREIGFKVQRIEQFNYRGGKVDAARTIAAVLYSISPFGYRWLRSVFGSRKEGVPGNGATMDHILCLLEATS
jgi:SAM-dependent methyltransferase